MIDKYNRINFMDIVDVEGKSEIDMVSNKFNDLEIKEPMFFYTIKSDDLKRPDLISIKFYGQQNYWWIIAKFNNIEDCFNDLYEGQILTIPSKNDIQRFYSLLKSKKLI